MKSRARLKNKKHTIDLDLKPAEGGSGKLLLGGSVVKGVCDLDIRKVPEDSALHGQLVQVGVEEGDDSLGKGR